MTLEWDLRRIGLQDRQKVRKDRLDYPVWVRDRTRADVEKMGE